MPDPAVPAPSSAPLGGSSSEGKPSSAPLGGSASSSAKAAEDKSEGKPSSVPAGAGAQGGKPVPVSAPPAVGAAAPVTIDDFKKLVFKVGKVVECADHTNANKLLVLKVDIGGGEIRQVVSGIKQWYQAAQLVGKSVVVVSNLAPANLRGVESQGMVLAASSGADVILVAPEKDALPGSIVK